MRPLVDLIGKSDEETQREEEAIEDVPVLDMVWVGEAEVATKYQGRQGGEAVIAICFNVVVTCDCQGIDVVLSEWADECLQGRPCVSDYIHITCKWT